MINQVCFSSTQPQHETRLNRSLNKAYKSHIGMAVTGFRNVCSRDNSWRFPNGEVQTRSMVWRGMAAAPLGITRNDQLVSFFTGVQGDAVRVHLHPPPAASCYHGQRRIPSFRAHNRGHPSRVSKAVYLNWAWFEACFVRRVHESDSPT